MTQDEIKAYREKLILKGWKNSNYALVVFGRIASDEKIIERYNSQQKIEQNESSKNSSNQ